MVDLTIRLPGRNLHLVRRAADSEHCKNHAAHRLVEVRSAVQAEIDRAVLDSVAALTAVRDLVAEYVPPLPTNRVLDAEILKHFAWLLETERLVVVECVEVPRGFPDSPARSEPLPPGVQPRTVSLEDPKTWVAIQLLDDKGKPVPGQRYRVKVPGGVVEEGILDDKGQAKIINLDPGTCDISFPDIHAKEWKPA